MNMRSMTGKKWIARETDKTRTRELSDALGTPPALASLLVMRGIATIEEARRVLHPHHTHLHDPSLMLGMPQAVKRILRAIDNHERILVYGDYDVDGTMGTVVLRRALELLGAETGFHVPHRFTEGYGVHREALEKARDDGYSLVVTVDCGIRAHEPLEWARENNLDVIVTDHHLPDEILGAPSAVAVINPNQKDCPYPDKNLAGVGVAYKLAHALLRERGRESLVGGFLKIVAIGTVADVAPLTGENRVIVRLGLNDLPQATNPGLRALMDVAGCGNGAEMRAYDLGFRLGPRINAAGRMDAARGVVELFEVKDESEARRLAELLDGHNRERRVVQERIVERAFAELNGDSDENVHIVVGDDWHRGVIGLAASKIAERRHRPCIVISMDGDTGHGSARSIEAYHLLDGLTSCADLFERFGGHSHAAGLVIRREHIPELRRRLNEHAAGALCDDDFMPTLNIDAELSGEDLTCAFAAELSKLEPFGAGWPRPVFSTADLRITRPPRVLKDRHLKFHLEDGDGRVHETLWWNGVEHDAATLPVGARIELAYSLETNVWRGEERVQLIAYDARLMME
ncbi:MAG: single-stranded-DNA-specific exonuclease RecJ [Pyrinomonadaceae bacterium]|nr:single-stranded-DNA-specific exonuclease RecJ [Pyrinomonadaceae bacterium]